jgi:GntR family transcriptional regulator
MADPMYRQIAQDLQGKIESGELTHGQKLPSEMEFRERYNNASRNTIRDAIKRLTSQGLVETKPGQGTFVTMRIVPFVTELSGDPQARAGAEGTTYLAEVNKTDRIASLSDPRVEIHRTAPAQVGLQLRVPPNTQVVSRHEMRYIDGLPWSLQTSFYPMDFVAKGATGLLMAENIKEGAVRYIADTIGIRQVGYRDWITARRPDVNEQTFFALAHDGTVFENFRTAFDQTGTPLRVTVTIFPADRNQFIFNVGDVPDPEYSADRADPREQSSEPA